MHRSFTDPPIPTTALFINSITTHNGIPIIVQMLLHKGVTSVNLFVISYTTNRVMLQMFATHSIDKFSSSNPAATS